MAAANEILQWVRRNGEVMAVSRLSVRLMDAALKERVLVRGINESTLCSEEFLREMRREASIIVGKQCPK